MDGRGIIGRAASQGLYANIAAKRERIKAGSGERMRKPNSPGAPSNADFKAAAKTARK
jgi:hypothetical protein